MKLNMGWVTCRGKQGTGKSWGPCRRGTGGKGEHWSRALRLLSGWLGLPAVVQDGCPPSAWPCSVWQGTRGLAQTLLTKG